MQKQKTYLTPEGHTVIATFYRSSVAWKIKEKPLSNFVDDIVTFFNKMAAKGWREIESS